MKKVYCVYQASGSYDNYFNKLEYVCATREQAEKRKEELDDKVVTDEEIWVVMPEDIFFEFDELINSYDHAGDYKGFSPSAFYEQEKIYEASLQEIRPATIVEMDLDGEDLDVSLLKKAFNNRTRQCNYFGRYIDMSEGVITDKEFDKEIEEDPSFFVPDEWEPRSPEYVRRAVELAQDLMGFNSSHDLQDMFGIDRKSMMGLLDKETNEEKNGDN